jgi:hypothetical protein
MIITSNKNYSVARARQAGEQGIQLTLPQFNSVVVDREGLQDRIIGEMQIDLEVVKCYWIHFLKRETFLLGSELQF